MCKNNSKHIEDEKVKAVGAETKAPTCTEKGETTYTATFTNTAFAKQQKTVADIPATGHNWDTPTYEWTPKPGGYDVTATVVCKNNAAHKITETVSAVYSVVTEPAPYADGVCRYTATFADEHFTVQTKDEPIPMLVVTYYGEEVTALDQYVTETGERLFPYRIRIKNLPDGKLGVDSMQIFLTYDHETLTFRRGEGAVDWMLTDNNGVLSALWASETETEIRDGDVVLTLYFARTGDIAADETVAIDFTENALGFGSALSYVANGRVIELAADTIGGGIRFEMPVWGDANCDGIVTAADAALILRSLVGLSELSSRGAVFGDVDGDGEITAADAAMILRYVINLIDRFPAA